MTSSDYKYPSTLTQTYILHEVKTKPMKKSDITKRFYCNQTPSRSNKNKVNLKPNNWVLIVSFGLLTNSIALLLLCCHTRWTWSSPSRWERSAFRQKPGKLHTRRGTGEQFPGRARGCGPGLFWPDEERGAGRTGTNLKEKKRKRELLTMQTFCWINFF